MLSLNDTFQPAENTAHETVEGQTVIINLNTGVYISLNATGSFLWERLDGQTPLATISADLAESCAVETGTTDPDVLELMQGLLDEGLVLKI